MPPIARLAVVPGPDAEENFKSELRGDGEELRDVPSTVPRKD